jgi:WD40 repeat protein
LWGLATSPNKNLIVTSGGDKTVRLWDIIKNKMIASTKPLPKDVRGVDWGICNGKEFIVAADVTGVIYLLSAS